MAYIVRDGVRVYFEDHGSGPGVLLSHGFSQSSAMWRDQVAVSYTHLTLPTKA